MKNIMKIQHLLLILIIGLPLSSCLKSNETDADKRQQEDQQIADYVKTKGYNVSPSASGLYFIPDPVEVGTGDSPLDTSDFVVIRYRGWTLDGRLFDATDSSAILNNTVGIIPLYAFTGPLKFSMKVNYPGWIEGLKQMKAGGKATLIMPSILSLTPNDFIPKKYEIELVEVIHNIAAYERQKIESFVLSNGKNLGDSLTNGSSHGIYYFETLAGTGASPSNGKIVSVQYTGKLIDGRVFQQTTVGTNYNFTVGSNYNISGFNDAVNLMKKGGKATVVIPYYWGYGPYVQTNNYGQIVFPWYTTLVFIIELVNVQ